jgi:excisionase family DNA binding protein
MRAVQLTLAEAAAALGVSPRTLRRRIDAGLIPVFRDSRIIRISSGDLERYVLRRTVPTAMRSGRSPATARPKDHQAAFDAGGRLWDAPDPLASPRQIEARPP